MTTAQDHIAYLSQEIGPRPAGTEEEQQAALYITERLQKEAHLQVAIEDFTCNNNHLMPQIICYGLALVAVILGLALPVAGIPAAIVTIIAAALLVCEKIDHPVLSQIFLKGVSQNVVAKYEPTYSSDGVGQRRRKVIITANYDSGKVRHDTNKLIAPALRWLHIAALAGMVVAALAVLLRSTLLPEGGGSVFMIILAVLGIIAPAALLVFAVMEKVGQYTEAANNNAAGIAVMLEVARRLGNGEVSADAPVEGQTSSFEAAKQALDAQGGEGARVHDIASSLVQVKEPPIAAPASDEVSQQRRETAAALAAAPLGTLAEAAAKAAALGEQRDEAAPEAAETVSASEAATAEAVAEAPVEDAVAPEPAAEAEPVVAAPAVAAPVDDSVPDWYRKATERAREKNADAGDDQAASYRSRFADYPTGIEAAAEPEPEPEPVVEPVVEQAPAEAEAVEPEVEAIEETPAPAEPEVAEEGTEPEPEPEPVAAAPAPSPASTTAMPAVQAGSLDLAALRASAMQDTPADQPSMENPPVEPEQAPAAQPAAPEAAMAAPAAAAPAAATTRLPQLMYYNAPADRSDVLEDRAQKDRVTVSADEAEAPVQPFQAQGAIAAFEQAINQEAEQPEEQQPRVIAANIPVVDLPRIELPPITVPEPKPVSFDELRQRAPLASVAEGGGQDAAKNLLQHSVPTIEPPSAAKTTALGAFEVPTAQTNNNVSLTGSFAAIGAIGAQPVGDELLEGIDPDDIYVDDADDTVFQEEFTETGAFAGPGYVDMPQSRAGKFFSRFRRKKKAEETSAQAWLGVDDDFDARSAGKARGGWESFRDDEDDWEGGAFSNLKARVESSLPNRKQDAAPVEEPAAATLPAEFYDDVEQGEGFAPIDDAPYAEAEGFEPAQAEVAPIQDAAPVSSDSFASAYEAAVRAAEGAGDKIETVDDIQRIYSFAAGDVNTEVWFVGLGSELADNGGIKAFLANHASEMRGAVIVNLEALGAGTLSYLDYEGDMQLTKCPPRMKRYLKKAQQAAGVTAQAAKVDWRESPASIAAKHRMQAVTIAGMEGNVPALYASADDVVENIDPAQLDQAADLVVELLKNI